MSHSLNSLKALDNIVECVVEGCVWTKGRDEEESELDRAVGWTCRSSVGCEWDPEGAGHNSFT